MTTETVFDLAYDRIKSSKRPLRPKLLKLTDVTIPHRSRKKIKVKSKDRSTTVRDRIYDDPAYTEDISHLANPLRRSSLSGKSSGGYNHCSEATMQSVASSSSLGKRSQLTKDFLKYAESKTVKASNSGALNMDYEFDSSSSDNEKQKLFKDGSIPRRVLSLERSLAATVDEKNEKKAATQKRSSKQKRNLSLDNSRKTTQSHPQQTPNKGKQSYMSDIRNRKEHNRKQYLETEAQSGRGASEKQDISVRISTQNSLATLPVDATAKLPIGRRLLKGEIGIKSFNYYLLKEGLKSSKKLDKQRNVGDAKTAKNSDKKLHTRSEENIYEEIYFKDVSGSMTKLKSSVTIPAAAVQPNDEMQNQHQQQECMPDAGIYMDCELCMQQCSRENCKYCIVQGDSAASAQLQKDDNSGKQAATSSDLPAAHILEFQSYNPNNPGVYKIETTPVAITGEYNPILQFQQSSVGTSTTTTISPCEQQLHNHRHHQQQQKQQQPQQHIYSGFDQQNNALHHNIASNPLTNRYNAGGASLLLTQATPRRPNLQQGYIVGYQNGGVGTTTASVQRINTKSSSSSDSLPYHKYNTMARLEANVFATPAVGEIYYAIGGVEGPPMHPLMYAGSRPIGGSQILVDKFESQMYKSDSKASILSEFSLRSSDNSQRYTRYPHRSNIFSSHSNAHQRRYFGSTESCRIGYDCRRCSLDGIMSRGVMGMAATDKCTNSDNCRSDCRNCDCSSSYFSSDFDDIYGTMARGGSSGIPRKTAAGTLPSSSPADPSNYKQTPLVMPEEQPPQLDLKQNKYAMDFFKHVNDVKRSIYQSEMQRNNSLESTRRGRRNSSNLKFSPKRSASQPPLAPLIVTTLPLSKGRGTTPTKPTPAPRTSLQNQSQQKPPEDTKPPSAKRKPQPTERREYPSLDRLVASSTGAIPKWQSHTVGEEDPTSNKQKSKQTETESRERRDRSAHADSSGSVAAAVIGTSGKRHHRSSSGKTHPSVSNQLPIIRRKDIPAPPPPSPATYSDLQELKANMEGLQDDTKSRSLESETSETPTTTTDLMAVKIAQGTVTAVATALKALAPIAELTVKSNTGTSASKAAPETEDDDVFYDARSENSTGGLSVLPTAEGAVQTAIAMGQPCKDACIIQPELDNFDILIQSAVTILTTTDRSEQQQQLPKAIVENAIQTKIVNVATVSATTSRQSPNDDEVGEATNVTSTMEAGSKKSLATCCQSEAVASIQQNEATVKTNSEAASTTKRNNNTSTSEVITRNVDATCVEGQETSLTATNVSHKYTDSNNDNNSTTIEATLELEFSCKSAHTDSAPLVHSEPPTVPAATAVPTQDYTCLDSSEAFSDDSHLTRDSVTRESQNDELSSSTVDKLDLSTLPLPALPPKRRRTRSRASPSKYHHQQQQRLEDSEYADVADSKSGTASSQIYRKQKQEKDSIPDSVKADLIRVPDNTAQQDQQLQPHISALQQYVAKRRDSLEASTRNFNEKLEARRKLCHMGGTGGISGASATSTTDGGVPTYLFGEQFYGAIRKSKSPLSNKEEIFLNKSGWVQVSTKPSTNSKNQSLHLNYSRRNADGAMQDKIQGRNAIRVIQSDHAHRPELCRQPIVHHLPNRCEREPKFVGSKVEELIQRNEARLSGLSSKEATLRPGYRIVDPQLASILNERPGFLPVNDLESPPPVTPILSPPPAFQDNSSNIIRTPWHQERRKFTRQSYTPTQQPRAFQPMLLKNPQQQQPGHGSGPNSVKGMVFSRSFEYDTRRPTNTYVETFSRSFDDNLSERPSVLPSLAVQRERSLNFSTLTGNSPNYLSKREGSGGGNVSNNVAGRPMRSRDNSPKYLQPQTTAYLNASVKEAPPGYSVASSNIAKYSPRSRHDRTFERSKSHNVIGRSRKSQFNCMGSSKPGAQPPSVLGMSRFRSLDTTINNRLNSCDSGARSDLSNDEIDNEDGSSTEFLSATNYQYPNMASGCASISPFKAQRSLTPDRNDSHSSSSSLRKQRSLTPESRSLTPEERRKRGSQISLIGSRQSSSSHNNTLDRRHRHEDKTPPIISRSSSSSSYSRRDSHEPLNSSPSTTAATGGLPGAANYRRSVGRSATKQTEHEHLIRRSSERSPNRGQKSVICVGTASSLQKQAAPVHYQQANSGIFPNSMRTTGLAANKMLASSNGTTGHSTRLRQSDVDKACSFDFDYNNYNRSGSGSAGNAARSSTHTSGSGGDSGSNQNLWLDCDKSRSFDEDYREALLNNNGSSGAGIRFLQPGNESNVIVSASSTRLRQSSSPVGTAAHEHMTTRSPQSSGSSSNNLHQTSHRTSSPQSQSYGTRLCDHELTYEMLRKSPIMNFRRDTDYELPVQLRNRETINSGGNSELNFMSNETHIYEHPTTVLKPHRSVSREDHLYRSTAALPRSSSPEPQLERATTNKKCKKSLTSCDYWPRCDACCSTSTSNLQYLVSSASVKPVVVRKQNSSPAVIQNMQQQQISEVTLNGDPIKLNICTATTIIPHTQQYTHSKCTTPQWTFLCSGGVNAPPENEESGVNHIATTSSDRRQPTAVIRPRVVPSAISSLEILGDCEHIIRTPLLSEQHVKEHQRPARKQTGTLPSNFEENSKRSKQSQPSTPESQSQQSARTRNGNQDLDAILKKANSGSYRKRQRCHSLPSRITASQQLLTIETTVGLPKKEKDDISVIDIRCNGYVECLSQQMRAISSPTLTGSFTEQKNPHSKHTVAIDSATNPYATKETSGGSTAVGGGSCGVLQKFKRTLHNLNYRNQLQMTPLTGGADLHMVGKSSPPAQTLTAPAQAKITDALQTVNFSGDTSSAKYRFGPLIWRSSKERQKAKFNRRDKCNSGDSGIQIELEHDEHYVRALAGAQRAAATLINTSQDIDAKARSIRRSHSAKASNILEQTASKPPVYKELKIGSDCSIEREAPESLPTRSISQPSGLDIYGVRRAYIEDSDSDSIASHEEANSYHPIYAEVLYNFTAAGPQELGLERGTVIEILRKELGPWWFGRIKKQDASIVEEILDPELGWFPKDFVRIIHNREIDEFFYVRKTMLCDEPVAAVKGFEIPVPVSELDTSHESPNATITIDQSNITTIVIESPPSAVFRSPTRINTMQDSCHALRKGAVRELLETEVNYVKLLAAICDGYLPVMSKRIDIFSPNSIRLIFSNITAIYKFQQVFLEELRQGIEQNQISKVFLKMYKGFLCYSTYCNAYPRALIELESYERIKDAHIILEKLIPHSCRESENLAELPLSAHLLAPVQRICRYPLHLNELIKTAVNSESTVDTIDIGIPTDTLDYEQIDVSKYNVADTHDTVNMALEKMRGITEAVNEGKRHSETIARHQASFQNFKGTPLHLQSTRFFFQVDATRQKQNLWNSSYTLFLFDNQLIYCKRDIIKRSNFIYKGRIFLDRCRIVNVRDEKMFGHTIKNSLRIYCELRDKWYDFSFRSANRKHRFLNTLALERQFSDKALYVSEMTGFEYNYEERPGDFSDQSDYELPDCEHALGTTSASGDSSVPESPSKSPYRSCDTLPKKSQSRDAIASTSHGSGQMLTTTSTGSLGRRRLGNWFRKPKSSNCTPSQSPTHKSSFDADLTLTAARVAAIEMAAAAEQEEDSSFT
ncbi:uncharacterized protein LOC6556691 isoform X3 [Drosophila grimshawi]|uniref:uncharacterized protein LOC6556691 isoform X3 n=1 Tax=Drosophila grimshawi TaxID=7222 RepID=UPI000C870A7B|nr:uncharacterized protein LOC6556691 isoform X3 [Drosophila grimshawi]